MAALGTLTKAQMKTYWDDGYLFPIRVMSEDAAAALRVEIEAFEAKWLSADLPKPLNTYKRVNAQIVMPIAHHIGMHAGILNAVSGVLGPDVMLYSVEFFIKEAKTKQVVTMHQDLTYWGMGEIDGLTTAWLALSPSTPASGCMEMVKGSHKSPILPHEDSFDDNNLLSRGQEIKVEVAEEDRVPIVLQPGELSLHHGLTIHGSGPNTSDDRRLGVVVRYLVPEIRKAGGERDYAHLARGTDAFDNWAPSPPPRAPFAPEALALYETVRDLQTSVMMRGAAASGTMYDKADA